MSGTSPKTLPEINLDEFERRLRAAGAPSTGVEDPLAELTRLVNAVHSDAKRAARPVRGEMQLETADLDMEEPGPAPAFVAPTRAPFALAQTETEDQSDSGDATAPSALAALAQPVGEAPQRSSGWTFKVVALSALGVVLLVGAVAIKNGRVPGLAKAPPFIAADDAPTKVQPPSDATVQTSGDIATLLMKDSAAPTPVKVVNNEEQPVDLRTQTQPTGPDASPTTVSLGGSAVVANAPDTPVVPPAAPSASVAPLFPSAKPVKAVSVRPDGTLLAPDPAPVATPPQQSALPAPAATPAPAVKSTARALDSVPASPEAATPKLDLPTKIAPPKPAARTVAKTDTTAPADATDTTPNAPLQLGAPRPGKPAKVAPQTIAEADAAAAAPPAPAAPQTVASAEPAADGDGQWAVQLSAPRSEADAKSAIARLKSKYADALGDSALGVHQADVKGQTIYRVRVTGLSRSDAGALCTKLKAGGGDCFVAKD